MVSSAKLSLFRRRKDADCTQALPPAFSSDSPLAISVEAQSTQNENQKACACQKVECEAIEKVRGLPLEPQTTQNEVQKACACQKVEWEAIDKARGQLISKLQRDLKNARAQQRAAQVATEESRARSGELEAQLARLGAELEEEKRARAAQIQKLEASLEAARDAGGRRDEERERFDYVLAHNGQTGSVSRTLLASDSDSLLYKTYCGDWEYPRDGNGRAVITCHPKRWAAVLEHLTNGTVPAEPDSPLLNQARYWNLGRLVRGLEALYPGVVVSKSSGSGGFKVMCTFTSVIETLKTVNNLSIEYAARNQLWTVQIDREGIWHLFKPPSRHEYMKRRGQAMVEATDLPKISVRFKVLLDDEDVVTDWEKAVFPDPATYRAWGGYATWDEYETHCKDLSLGFVSWRRFGYSLQQMVTQPLARAHDSLSVEVEVLYVDSVP